MMNKNDRRRHKILGIDDLKYGAGGLTRISNVTLEQITTLNNEGFLDVNDRQGNGPTVTKFIEFLENHPNFCLEGYIITPKRSDYRVSFDTIVGNDCSDEDVNDFNKTFKKNADEFEDGQYCRAWWD